MIQSAAKALFHSLARSTVLKQLAAHWARLDQFEGNGYERILTTVKLRNGIAVDAYIYQLRGP